MAPLDSRGDLAAAEVAFYAPALIAAVAICTKQGFARNVGWLYLVTLAILRLIGASVTIDIEVQQDFSRGLLETAAITSSIGLTPLLLVLMGLLTRTHAQMADRGLSQNVFRPIHLVGLAGLAVGIYGGVKKFDGKQSDYDKGKDASRASAILFLFVYLSLAAITLYTALARMAYVPRTEKKIITAAICALPFLLVRVIYSIGSAFGSLDGVFSLIAPDVWVQAFMMFLMEVVCVLLYSWAGLFSPKQVPVAQGFNDMEQDGVKLSAAPGSAPANGYNYQQSYPQVAGYGPGQYGPGR